jgi:hypothetical protein
MLHSFFRLFSLKSATILLLCLSLGLSPAKGSAMSCVEDDCNGIWWSRSGGRMALLAGGAIALGAIAGAIAGYSSSSCHSCHSHSSSNGLSYSSGPGTQPFANEFQSISSSSGSYSSYFGSDDSSISRPILRNKGVHPTQRSKTETGHHSKSCPSSAAKGKHSSTDAEASELTFCFSLSLANHTGVTLFTPIVTTAEGGTIEGSPTRVAPHCTSLQLAPLTVSNAKPGTYRVGVRTAQISTGTHPHWQGEFTTLATNSDGTSTALNGKLKDGDLISTREYVYTPRE